MRLPQTTSPRSKPTNNKFLNALRLGNGQGMFIGSKSTRKTSMNVSVRLLLSSNRDISWRKVRSTSANIPRRNGSSVNTTPRRSHMSEKTWKRNTTGMTAHANLRKEQKRKGVDDAIAALLREQKPVNFNSVARRRWHRPRPYAFVLC